MGRDPQERELDAARVRRPADGQAQPIRQHDDGLIVDRDHARRHGGQLRGARAGDQQRDARDAAPGRLRGGDGPRQRHPAAERAAGRGRVLGPRERHVPRRERHVCQHGRGRAGAAHLLEVAKRAEGEWYPFPCRLETGCARRFGYPVAQPHRGR